MAMSEHNYRNIKLLVQYDGTRYRGFQFQPFVRTIQGRLEAGLAEMIGHRVPIRAASRTDSGVHALGMVVNFHTTTTIPCHGFKFGLNALIPKDIAVIKATEVDPSFDSRNDSLGKTYIYKVRNRPIRDALQAHRMWHVHQPLDHPAMEAAAAALTGSHNFSSFRSAHCDSKSTDRDMHKIAFSRSGDIIEIEVCANAFMRNMVRIIVGTLIDVGRGRLDLQRIHELLVKPNRSRAGITAPACGLYLKRIYYDEARLFDDVGHEVPIFKKRQRTLAQEDQ